MASCRIFLIVCLTFAALASGRIAENKFKTLYPYRKSLHYKYTGEIKSESTESATSASNFFIHGDFFITHYTDNPNLKNAYIIALQNATTSLKNRHESVDPFSHFSPSSYALEILQNPFGVIFKDCGLLESVAIPETEPVWSKNIKFAWAELLQLKIKDLDFKLPIPTQSFVEPENTIHGVCQVSYDLHPKDYDIETQTFSVMKFTSPMQCSQYKPFSFDYVDVKLCMLPEEEQLSTATTKTYEIKIKSNGLWLEKFNSHGEINYFPFVHNPQAFYVLYNATFTLENARPSSEYTGPTIDFNRVPSTQDWSYQRTNSPYAPDAALDITNGRHSFNRNDLINEVKIMLINAANHLKKNHIGTKSPDWEHSKAINNIREALTYLDASSFETIFSSIRDIETEDKKIIVSLFLGIVPQVGTTAANLFVFSIVLNRNVTDFEAIEMIAKLPINVRVPSEALLSHWESFSQSAKKLSPKVYKVVILATGTMVYRTYPFIFGDHPVVNRFLDEAYNELIDAPTYEIKVVWLGVIHNIQSGDIAKLLTPILRGEVVLSERPHYIRLLSIGAMLRSLYINYDRAIDLLWPVMTNCSLPLKLRIGSYNILLQQSRTMTDFLRIHWYMVNEKNQHLYNFHITTLQGFAKTHCPCFAKMQEYSAKVLELTPPYTPVSKHLTALYVIDTMNDVGDGVQLKITVVRDQFTNVPEIIYVQQFIMKGHKITSYWAVYIQSDGMDNMLKNQNSNFLAFFEGPVTETFIFDFIRKFSIAMTLSHESFVDILVFYRDQAVIINYYDHESLKNFNNDVEEFINHYSRAGSCHVFYQEEFEESVVSDFGTPVTFGAQSPLTISWDISPNKQGVRGFAARVNAKVWLSHDYFISAYNPLADIWQSAERLSVVNADVSFHLELLNSNGHKILSYIDPRDWNLKFQEANVSIHNQGVVSIKNINNSHLITEHEIHHHRDNGRNLETVTFTNEEKVYEASLFNCDEQPSNITHEDYIKVLPSFENFDLIMFPLKSQFKNCGNIIKIRPSK